MPGSSKLWLTGLVASLLFLGWFLTLRLTAPFTDVVDFNAAVWSQAAHNLLKAGLATTGGVPADFYFGPLPIPADDYYCHHPALLHLEIAALFRLFGEHEWVARLLPILCSLVSALLLWLIVKECAGARTASFATALFATLPMELHYGSMVNFEPCTLMWLLLGVLGLRHWELSGNRKWGAVMVVAFGLAMFTAWLGYFLVLALCIHFTWFARKKRRKLALLLFGIALLSVALFMLQIRWVKPDAWSDLAEAFRLRLSHNVTKGVNFTFKEWTERVGDSILIHFPAVIWLLAIGGAIRAINAKRAASLSNPEAGRSNLSEGLPNPSEGLHWLNWISFCFIILSAVYVVGFRNASYIHDYASFYFLPGLAIMGGIALEGVASWINGARKLGGIGLGSPAVIIALVVIGIWGYRGAQDLNAQSFILETEAPEPANLVPELGKLIQKEFAPETSVFFNFAVDYCPQLGYYSQRNLINGMPAAGDWLDALKYEETPPGGVIWMGAPEAKEIVSAIPGSKREVKIDGVPFCIWHARL